MADKKRFRLEWIIIIVLVIIIIIGSFILFKRNRPVEEVKQKPDSLLTPKEAEAARLMNKYEKLEQAYNLTLNELEHVINEDDISLNILRENLRQILETIKEDKENIHLMGDSSKKPADNTKQLEDMLNMSKEVLAERLLEEKQRNEKLTIDNRKLYMNLKKFFTNFESEKVNNVKLNDNVSSIKDQIKSLKIEGVAQESELKILERQKSEMEKKLSESNRAIKSQNQQFQELAEIIRKVNMNCYYIYERGVPEEEAKIYLTSGGITEKYVQYFVRKKPDIYVEFQISSDFFPYKVSQFELKLLNSLNVEIYSITKPMNFDMNRFIIPNKNFAPGKYSLVLKVDEELLILDDRYIVKISN
jgi:hypothetical protein